MKLDYFLPPVRRGKVRKGVFAISVSRGLCPRVLITKHSAMRPLPNEESPFRIPDIALHWHEGRIRTPDNVPRVSATDLAAIAETKTLA